MPNVSCSPQQWQIGSKGRGLVDNPPKLAGTSGRGEFPRGSLVTSQF